MHCFMTSNRLGTTPSSNVRRGCKAFATVGSNRSLKPHAKGPGLSVCKQKSVGIYIETGARVNALRSSEESSMFKVNNSRNVELESC